MRPTLRRMTIAGVILAIICWSSGTAAQKPSPWRLVKEAADAASASIDPSVGHGGAGSVRLTVEHRTKGEVAVLQPLRAEAQQGKRVRFTGFMTATITTGEAGLVVVVNNGGRYSEYSSSQGRIAPGEAGWRLLTVTLDVPGDATLLSIGMWLRRGNGSVWLDDVTFDEVSNGTGTPSAPRRSAPMTRSQLEKLDIAYQGAQVQPGDLGFDGPATVVDPW